MITREYDTYLFSEIIESIQGILFIRQDEKDGIKIRVYQGINGRVVFIDASDEEILEPICKLYLAQLGIEYLIDSLFPPITTPKLDEPIPPSPVEASKN